MKKNGTARQVTDDSVITCMGIACLV